MSELKTTISEVPEKMKPSEYYEKYILISDGHGNMVSPRKLTEAEKDFIDKASEEGADTVFIYSKRRRSIQIGIRALEHKMEQHLADFLKQKKEHE